MQLLLTNCGAVDISSSKRMKHACDILSWGSATALGVLGVGAATALGGCGEQWAP